MLLYHGSPENTASITVHDADGPFERFDGIFSSSNRNVALSHGDNIFSIEIPASQILMSDQEPEDDITHIFAGLIDYDSEDLDLIYDALVWENYDQYDSIWQKILGITDPAEIGWTLQNLRGRLASALGYKAVEMHDEHGISYFLVPGNVLTREEEDSDNA